MSGNFVPETVQSLAAETKNGPSVIAVAAIAQGCQTAPESADDEPSEGTFSAWMPAAKVVHRYW